MSPVSLAACTQCLHTTVVSSGQSVDIARSHDLIIRCRRRGRWWKQRREQQRRECDLAELDREGKMCVFSVSLLRISSRINAVHTHIPYRLLSNWGRSSTTRVTRVLYAATAAEEELLPPEAVPSGCPKVAPCIGRVVITDVDATGHSVTSTLDRDTRTGPPGIACFQPPPSLPSMESDGERVATTHRTVRCATSE